MHAGRSQVNYGTASGHEFARTKVMQNLAAQGFHLQMPPKLEPWLYHGNAD